MEKQLVKTNIHPLLRSYLPIAEGIASTFGEFCEVTLHDFSDVSSSIVAIFNGEVTGRRIGSPVTNLGLEILRKGENGEDLILNYPNSTVPQKYIKSSSMIIRDEHDEMIGCLCINMDLTYLKMNHTFAESLMATNQKKTRKEEFSQSITELEDEIIEDAVNQIGKPVALMNKEEREAFIAYLDKKGLFLIKGAVQRVATLLDISKYTMYNYLDKSQS
ncbi:transcriptional regulator [Evansella clarkii]|uniref:helix-turn-helix transcriptional regulator n=1 Tax=Evansella clarkii TaxID=79879 RepID=UPI000B437CE5|nr:PAS domain-containing protein [Evansella clarkii]